MKTVVTLCIVAFCTIQNISCIVVDTEYGKLRGVLETSPFKNFYSFRGIPYAKPPINELRFKAPEDPEPWSGVRDATKYGPRCPNFDKFSPQSIRGSEDCLFLNVHTLNMSRSLPVLVYFNGDAFAFDNESEMYGPHYLVAKEVVVVTNNYRFGRLGFSNFGTKEVPGNAGLKDQVKVLKWVQKNIKKFGGDPDNVTIFGVGFGAASVTHHLASSMSKDYFHRAIALNGIYNTDILMPLEVEEKSYMLGRSIGIKTKNKTDFLLQMQQVPYYSLFEVTNFTILAFENVWNLLFEKTREFVPVMEEDFGQQRFITENFMNNYKMLGTKNILLGYSHQESLTLLGEQHLLLYQYGRYPELLLPSKILYNIPPSMIHSLGKKVRQHYFQNKNVNIKTLNKFVRCTSWSNIIYDVVNYAEKVSQAADTYLFKLSSYPSRISYSRQGAILKMTGAGHDDPGFYIFNVKPYSESELKKGSKENQMVDQIVTAITNFAKTGRPADDAKTWPRYTKDSQNYVEFTDTMTLKHVYDEDDKEFWDGIYRAANLTYYLI